MSSASVSAARGPGPNGAPGFAAGKSSVLSMRTTRSMSATMLSQFFSRYESISPARTSSTRQPPWSCCYRTNFTPVRSPRTARNRAIRERRMRAGRARRARAGLGGREARGRAREKREGTRTETHGGGPPGERGARGTDSAGAGRAGRGEQSRARSNFAIDAYARFRYTVKADVPEWRNGRRGGLKNRCLTTCEFDSRLGHQFSRFCKAALWVAFFILCQKPALKESVLSFKWRGREKPSCGCGSCNGC